MKKFRSLIALFGILLFISCSNDDGTDNPNPDPEVIVNEDEVVDNFVWRGMNYWYLYKDDVANLDDSKNNDVTTFRKFLSNYESPERLFDDLLTKQTLMGELKDPPFSWIVDDYIALEQLFSGISTSNGMEFSLIGLPDSQDVLGVVRYVLPGTDAEAKEIKRGQYFNSVNGTKLQRGQDFNQIFSPNSYTLQFVNFNGTSVTGNLSEVTLNKVEYTENPVFISKIIEYKEKRIGYLMYNSFTFNFNEELNNAFAGFQGNIDELVLDLRYNGGGSVYTAIALAGMIKGNLTGQVFNKRSYNANIEDLLNNQSNADLFFSDRFFDNVLIDLENRTEVPINSLDLSKLYVLASGNSASASELIMNGLEPYMDVIHIGTNTAGKFQFSQTLYDAPAPNFARGEANPNHTYALQPLTGKSSNINGKTDYIKGLEPDILFRENLFMDLGTLGEVDEPFLKAALDFIADGTLPAKKKMGENLNTIWESKMNRSDYQRMYIDQVDLSNLK